MGTNSLLYLSKILITTTISTGTFNYWDDSDSLIPTMNHHYNYKINVDNLVGTNSNLNFDYFKQDDILNKVQIIEEFSYKVINNSKDIDNEYVNIVNENFWDLL